MAGRLYRHRHTAPGCEGDGFPHLGRVPHADDQRGPVLPNLVEPCDLGCVTVIAGPQNRAAEAPASLCTAADVNMHQPSKTDPLGSLITLPAAAPATNPSIGGRWASAAATSGILLACAGPTGGGVP